jgi:hypothetical protein
MNTNHLDDEALSAAIDGEAEAGALVHLATCAACRRRLEALRAAASAVSTPPPRPSPLEVDRAIAAALDAALEPAAGSPDSSGGGRRRAAIVALFPRRPAIAALAAAAVIVLAAGITGALRWNGSSSRSNESVSLAHPGAPKSFSSAGAPVGAGPGAAASGVPVLAGPDLGAQSDPAVVAGLVRARITSGPYQPGAAVNGPRANAGGTGPSPQASPVAPTDLTCAPEAAQAVGVAATSPLRLVAGLQWRGQAAVVFVFDRPGSAGGLAGVIVRRSDCAALVTLPL